MLDRIIRFSLSHRMLVLLSALVLTLAGVYSAWRTEVDIFPDLNAPTVVVMTEAGGMAAEEVEQLVTYPIETAVNGAAGVRRVRSQSTHGFSVVWVEFDWGTDIYLARQIVGEKLSGIAGEMPDGVSAPTLGPQSSILGEMMIVSLTRQGGKGSTRADSTTMQDLRTLADWVVRPRLLATGGVAQVSVLGGDIREYQVRLDMQRMKHYGVTLDEVMQATRGVNTNVNGGVVNQYGNEYLVRGISSTADVDRLATCLIKKDGERVVVLSDVADVVVGNQQPRLGVASERGREAVVLTVTKQPGTGTVALTEQLDSTLADIAQQLPADVHVSTDIFRQSDFIQASISNVRRALIEGAFFVAIVLLLFLANVRTTVISLVSIPLSFLVTLIVLYLMDIGINTMTLGGLAIAIGSLVDDAIVDVENVYKQLAQARSQGGRLTAGRIKEVVYKASREVRMPILYSTLIIVVSFAPLFFLDGMEGRMLVPLGVAFITALFASTLVALTVTPVLCTLLLRGRKSQQMDAETEPKPQGESRMARWLGDAYGRMLQWVLRHRTHVLCGVGVMLLVSIVVFFTLGSSFLPSFNEGSFTINISTLPGVSLQESDSIGVRAERLLLEVPEIHTVARKTGRAEMDEHALGANVSEIEAPYVLDGRSREEVAQDVRRRLSALAGTSVEIGQPISHRIDAMLSGTQSSIAIKIFGPDLGRLYAIGAEVRERISKVEGVADLNLEQQVERPEIKITPRRELLVRNGITLPEFNEFLSVCLRGETVSQVYEGGRSFNLVVRAAPSDREMGMEEIRNLILDTSDGRKVPLTDVADVTSSAGPNTITRENAQRKIVLSANTDGRDLGSVVSDIRHIIQEEVPLPEDYRIEYGGQFESREAAGRILGAACLLAILVIYLLLYAQFRDARQAALVLLNLPLALIGGVLALWFTGSEVSIPAVIGFISLFGIATRNGMLLITEYNRLLSSAQMPLEQAVVQGSLSRLNPILMTALTSALALLPLALGGEQPGNEIQSPMAQVILGGLFSSTFLNAFVLPILYIWDQRRRTQRVNA